MSSIFIDPVCRRRIQPNRYARNGKLVSAEFQNEMVASLNQLLRHRTKCYGRFGGDVTNIPTEKVWRFASCTGPVTNAIVARILMAPATQTVATNNPRVSMTVYDLSGNVLTSGSAHFGSNWGDVPQEVPKEWGACAIALDMSGHPNTQFRAEIRANDEARPISACVYETSLPAHHYNGYLPRVSVGQPILDSDRGDMQRMANLMHKYGGAHLFNFSSETDATAPGWVGFLGGYQNVFDGTAGVGRHHNVSGPVFDRRHCGTKTRSTVPVVFEAFLEYTGGPGFNAEMQIVDVNGTVFAHWDVDNSPAAWQSPVYANIPADLLKLFIEVVSDGLNPLKTYAVCCYSYGA